MKAGEHPFQPVIIIGAGRSGTNMLRDALTQLPGYGTWPCDEINYIWRHGNRGITTDEFGPQQAKPAVRAYIQQTFAHFASSRQLTHVIEKTCANSLRVGFIHTILPNARYLFIVRDGRDVVASALKRWHAPLDLPYILKKARFIPPGDIPYYGMRYLGNRVYRLFSNQKRLAFWGPRFQGMKELLEECTLPEVCAYQWQRCVECAADEFKKIPAEQVYRLRYEDLVSRPEAEFTQLLQFLGVPVDKQIIHQLGREIAPSSVGKWQADLSPQALEAIMPIMEPTLRTYGYMVRRS